MKTKKIWFKNSKGQTLAGELYIPEKCKGTIILLSGIGGEDWGDWPNKLAELEFRVLTFNFRGRGKSEGEFIETTLATNIDDLKSAINFLDCEVALAGGSFGGTTSICIAIKDKRVKCLITMAAAHNLDDWEGGKRLAEAKEKGFAIGSEPWKKYSLELFKDTRKHKVLEKAKNVRVPWLIVHGDKDTSVPMQQAKDLYKAAKCAKKLAIIKGADHDFASKGADAQLFSLLVDWLEKYLK